MIRRPVLAGEALASPAVARAQRRVMVVLALAQIIGTVGVGIAPSIGVLLAGTVTQNDALAGLARTASTLGAALLGIPLGVLAARRGRRAALASGWAIAAGGAALLVLAAQQSLVVPLFLGLLMIGVGTAASLQARFAATDLAQPRHRARSLALIVWVGTLGSVLGPNLGLPGAIVAGATGLTVYAGAFAIAAVCLAVAALVTLVLLRPDPLLVLQSVNGAAGTAAQPLQLRATVRELLSSRRTRYPVVAILSAQMVMVAIMTMTPVHIAHHGGSVTVVGVTISLHIAGMYALAPLVGALVDRAGARITIGAGTAILLASLVVAAVASDDSMGIVVALILLGVGWSFVNVAGSALFSARVSTETRASAQGALDALSNLCGAGAALVAGPLLTVSGFSTLSLLGMAALLPLALLTLRRTGAGG